MSSLHMSIAAALSGALLLASCSQPANEQAVPLQKSVATATPEDIDLTGEWVQTTPPPNSTWQGVEIKGNTIEVLWYTGNGEDTSLFWSGSFTAPPPLTAHAYSWVSKNNRARTTGSPQASNEATLTFTYDNGVLRYDVTTDGKTSTITAVRN